MVIAAGLTLYASYHIFRILDSYKAAIARINEDTHQTLELAEKRKQTRKNENEARVKMVLP